MKQASIFLTGATGSVGSHLIQELISLNEPVKALVRDKSIPTALSGIELVELVEGDLDEPASFEPALKGIQKAFLLTNSSEKAQRQQLNFVGAAARAGVGHIVKLSQFAASEGSPVRFLRYHAAVENAIRASGISYTFLRPNLFMQGLLAFKDYIKENGQFFACIGHGRISAVDVRDIAAVAARCMTGPAHQNKIYDITGPSALTHYQMAEIFSKVLEKPVAFIDVTPEQMRAGLEAAGFERWQLEGLLEDYAHYARGEAAPVTSTVQELTGRSAISFEQFVKDYAGSFL
ncbi:MAG: NAD(P)-dependent oxidoreductase [Dyadobacter sp. 50-39]|uniref:SDR family oxidoreductase n=1 Tax=Dyadobacter sp. 50-39 TaxID=1895756 RepID=UPI000959C203|nr:SDR family oxidoreductase [Dyadobacter sp. 50-39]OJV15601.1 MAG: NAD(P)-dependent oxidoreductase [Dyadobacter sp. 50-39]